MSALNIDKGWLNGIGGSFVQLNAITALRVGPLPTPASGFNVDALVQGNWIAIAHVADEKAAASHAEAVLKELKNLFRYGT